MKYTVFLSAHLPVLEKNRKIRAGWAPLRCKSVELKERRYYTKREGVIVIITPSLLVRSNINDDSYTKLKSVISSSETIFPSSANPKLSEVDLTTVFPIAPL